jgi:oligoendopeptidase F
MIEDPREPSTQIALTYTWKIDSIFPDKTSWEAEARSISDEAQRFELFKGTLGQSAEQLYRALLARDVLLERVGRIDAYAFLKFAADTRDDEANSLRQRARTLCAQVSDSASFVEPEILSLGSATIDRMMQEHPSLETFRFLLSEVERRRAHSLSPEQEQLLAQLSPLSQIPESIRDAAHDGDMSFGSIIVEGKPLEVTHGNIEELLAHNDRDVRASAYRSYTDGYMKNAQSLGASLTAQARSSLIFCKARRYPSTFAAALFDDRLDASVYTNAMKSCYEHQHLFHRYFRARAKILGVEKIGEHDIMAKLSRSAAPIPYEKGVSLVLDALAPLGADYVKTAERGLKEQGWAHVFPAPGKYSNAFSLSAYGSHPFLLLNYAPNMTEVGTLAHELGHSMHSYFTSRAQPFGYSSYAMTVAETASNLNQALLRDHILKNADRETTLAVLDEAFYYAHRYLFLMPVLSGVEHAMHQAYARGGAWSCGDLRKATVTAFSRAYGDSVAFEPERTGLKWAQFSHFYNPYYLFQYAIGISAGMSIAPRLVAGEPGLKERYRDFLSAGASKPVQEIFKTVGVDITSREMYRQAFKVVEGYVEKLEELAQ